MKHLTLMIAATLALAPLAGCQRGAAPEDARAEAKQADDKAWPATDKRWGWLSFQTASLGEALPLQPVPGKVAALESETWSIQAPLAGRVERVAVHIGDRVSKGQVLLQIRSTDLTDLRREQTLARQALQLAQKQAGHAQTLAAAHAIAERDVLVVQQELRQAEVNLKAATDKLAAMNVEVLGESTYVIRAPRDGVVIKSEVLPGDEAAPDKAPLLVLANLNQLVIWAQVMESDLAWIREGDVADVRSTSQQDAPVTARVAAVSQAVDPEQRTVGVRLLTDRPAPWLRPNGYVQVSFRRRDQQALVVPAEAVVTDDLSSVVFVKHEDGRLERRAVTLGSRSGTQVELLKGVTPGETLVVKGAILLLNEVQP